MDSKTKALGASQTKVKCTSESKSSSYRRQKPHQEEDNDKPQVVPWSDTYVPQLTQYPDLEAMANKQMVSGRKVDLLDLEYYLPASVREHGPPSEHSHFYEEATFKWQDIEPVNPSALPTAPNDQFVELIASYSSRSDSD